MHSAYELSPIKFYNNLNIHIKKKSKTTQENLLVKKNRNGLLYFRESLLPPLLNSIFYAYWNLYKM
jgi:hypothetical protein